MADRRMFSNRIVGSAKFLKMPLSTQCLYFHLGLHADDDGVVEAFPVMRMLGATEDDLFLLASKEFVTVLNGNLVAFITNWTEHNKIRADRKVDSIYKELLLQVLPDEELRENRQKIDIRCIEMISDDIKHPVTDGIGKDRIGKDSISKYRTIVDYLNDKAGTSFKSTTKKTQSLINARLKEGFTLDDFRVVINKQCNEWKNDKQMAKYLRPETLFGTKFEGYLQAGGSNELREDVSGCESEAEDLDRIFRRGTESEVFGD